MRLCFALTDLSGYNLIVGMCGRIHIPWRAKNVSVPHVHEKPLKNVIYRRPWFWHLLVSRYWDMTLLPPRHSSAISLQHQHVDYQRYMGVPSFVSSSQAFVSDGLRYWQASLDFRRRTPAPRAYWQPVRRRRTFWWYAISTPLSGLLCQLLISIKHLPLFKHAPLPSELPRLVLDQQLLCLMASSTSSPDAAA